MTNNKGDKSMKNKRLRIFCGFSMVEMMLLLVIVSLMLASGVAVISKKHVKVPRLAVHGAYMCYVKNNQLHEEKYLGSGLTNKILDQDTAQCVFTPPARASYFHIQATGGGGGGGAAGYQGGNIVTYESKTEVITPFGIRQELLDLKGIAESELKNLGGTLWAYADGTGDFGDGGKGGDLYYIHQECSSDCLYYREWKYNGTRERECEPSQTQVTVTHIERQYSYPCTESCTGYYCDHCDEYEKDWGYNLGKDFDYCSTYETEDCGEDCTASECTSWDNYDDDGKYHYHFKCKSGKRKTDECYYGYNYTDYCEDGSNDITCYGTCTDTYGIPDDATCSGSYENLRVDVKNTYADNVGKLPSYRVLYTDGRSEPKLKRGEDLKERQVLRDKGDAQTICNYGNTSLYQNSANVDGIFGSFSSADGVGVECNTAALREAFGEQMYNLGLVADTSTHKTVKLGACEAYGLEDCSEKYAFPYYLLTEEKGGLSVFGESYRNVYNAPEGEGGSNTDNNPVWTDPYGNRHDDTYQSIQTGCDIDEYDTHDDTSGCDYYRDRSQYSFTGKTWTTTSREWATTSYSCPRRNPTSSESGCLYSYTDVAIHDPEQEKYCAYIPQVAAGGAKGIGKFCALNDVAAGLGIQYIGNSNIIAGISGSDLMLIGGDYAPLYTKAAWETSLNNTGAAETGTESQGSARVELGGNWCALHEAAVPGRGTGAKKEKIGEETVVPGVEAPSDGPGDDVGSIQGTGYTEDKSRKCGDNHVGYCLKASGKDINVRENGKYTYQYTWQTNYLQYGEGGKAGEYRVKIIRSFSNKNIEITLGRGGAGGTGPNDCDGKDGTDTIVGDLLTAKGGAGGKGCIPTSTEQLPYWYEDGEFLAKQPGGSGELASVTNYKTNIINLVLPVDNTILGGWMESSGAGGNGGGSTNNCWASEWARYFEGEQLSLATGGKLDSTDSRIQACRNRGYESEPGQDGFNGVVLIKW